MSVPYSFGPMLDLSAAHRMEGVRRRSGQQGLTEMSQSRMMVLKCRKREKAEITKSSEITVNITWNKQDPLLFWSTVQRKI